MALSGDSIYIRDADMQQIIQLRGTGKARWLHDKNMYQVPADGDVLDVLAGLCKLPARIEDYRQNLIEQARRLNEQRAAQLPESPDYPVKVKLFDHQLRAANMALTVMHRPGGGGRGFGLLFEMGCGKTLTAIAIMGALYRERAVQRVLIVAPASVCAVWPKEFEAYATFPAHVRVLTGSMDRRMRMFDELKGIRGAGIRALTINYEGVWRGDMLDKLLAWRPDLIIADESQRIKSPRAAQSKAMHRLGDAARYKLILSGTPVQNNAEDLWSQYRFLDASIFGRNFYPFRNRYAIMGGFECRKIIGYKNMDELVKKEYSIAYRVTKAEALDLPEQVFETRYIILTDKERTLYNDLLKQGLAQIEGAATVTASVVLTKLLRLQQMTGGFLQTDAEDKPRQIGHGKLDAVADILQDYVIDGGHKLVVFARFLPEIDALERLVKNKKIGYVRLNGGVPMAARGDMVKSFQEEPDVKVFIGQLDTVGLGVTLTAADTAVYYSVNFNFASYSQSLSRIHRIGQKNRCTYIHLVASDTVDEKILAALAQKEDLAKCVVDDWKKYF